MTTKIEFQTSMGNMVFELDEEKAPITVANFVRYVQEGHYEGTIFHRIINGFVVQGGGLTADMQDKKTNAPIENEANNGLKNEKYSLSMARTSDPHSATSQFFINLEKNTSLDFTAPTGSGWGYAVFGKVVEGTEVVDQMRSVKTGNAFPHRDVPVEPIIVLKASVL